MTDIIHSSHIKKAVETLTSGGIIAYPTEAVWGLGCDPWNRDAVERLLNLKSRAMNKGLILACGQMAQLSFLLDGLPPEKHKILTDSWPGPNTWLVPDNQRVVPYWIKGDHETVAVRVSKHLLIKEISAVFGHPIVSTSANPAGEEPAMSARMIHQYFGDQIDYVVPGELGGETQPSRIRSLDTGKIIRN
ncbi:L-threonylcarbamoyladenylate synthase [Alkalimarinus alittae]|uniref:Threonylcarbamoyl-AMP synthase n=1 Tax=Alkalimarinus alittae TaxID=2961619 RepID=A0ABY6N1Y7_9ALTE|nr:L-threonylcarbamoyladenylate synthase [Alkalimarinus alittae]UZE96125.1 L-threonylcarbamoyladenylate synthase [Alkalimarinus alittae]